jgi:hypothetical protein
VHLGRGSSMDSRRNTQVADFGVERHTLVIGGVHTCLPSAFNNSFTVSSIKGALIQGEGASFWGVIDSTCPI